MRTRIRYLLALTVLAGTGLVGAVVALPAQGGSEIKQGAAIAPVTLNMGGLNPALVREGSFIVNAQGGCNDCHTVPSYAPGGNPFLGEPELITFVTELRAEDGRAIPMTSEQRSSTTVQKVNGHPFVATLPLTDVPPGSYLLRVEGRSDFGRSPSVIREVPIEVK